MASSPHFVDYYAVLGLQQQAGYPDINNAYRRLALLYHPDKAGNDEETLRKFQQIQEAGDVLRDPLQRVVYDEIYDDRQENSPISQTYRGLHGEGRRRRRRRRHRKRQSASNEWAPPEGSQDVNQRYLFTHGRSVHMDPTSEESLRETARWVNELEAWEQEWAGIYQESWASDAAISVSREERRREGMAARCKRDEEEMAAEEEEERLLKRRSGMAARCRRDEEEMAAEEECLLGLQKRLQAQCRLDEGDIPTGQKTEQKEAWEEGHYYPGRDLHL
ncbi:hypothetical protein N7492_002379 [Penicillium capsulatum]|uniref:J domain-containing protein n=1 Tax=Penicillium capsulatum TaxID=69766 RepID=A0A9W9LVZ1_9EURO|nr:hypothetical protein N7492_002379 [Penicillium capsulatum]KAJ6123016.1 hypothetical protein N7512_005481 [Penicillium capsulatum]